MALVGLDVADEDKGVVLLNLLHGRLGVERVDEDLLSVHARRMGDRLARVLAGAGQFEGLGATRLSAGQISSTKGRAYRWKLVLVLMARFLFAYDCHLVNCARHTRSTARQRCSSDTTQEVQGRLTPRRAALAAALACLPVLVEAADIVSIACKSGVANRSAFAKFLATVIWRCCGADADVLLDAGLGPILAVLVVLLLVSRVAIRSSKGFCAHARAV